MQGMVQQRDIQERPPPRQNRLEQPVVRPPSSSASYPGVRAPSVPLYASFDSTPSSRTARNQSLSDVVGGRLLAWLGGLTTVIGIVLFLALAISRGWIGQEARVVIAAA